MAFLQHYFLTAWVAPSDQATNYLARKTSDGFYLFGFTGQNQSIQPGAMGIWRADFYAGPKDQVVLETIAPYLNLTVDYGFLWWIAIPLFKALSILSQHGWQLGYCDYFVNPFGSKVCSQDFLQGLSLNGQYAARRSSYEATAGTLRQ